MNDDKKLDELSELFLKMALHVDPHMYFRLALEIIQDKMKPEEVFSQETIEQLVKEMS
jgi:hypothetical protein